MGGPHLKGGPGKAHTLITPYSLRPPQPGNSYTAPPGGHSPISKGDGFIAKAMLGRVKTGGVAAQYCYCF